jgi:hemerythrin-like metal-binding protein
MNSLNFLKVWHQSFALHIEYAIDGIEVVTLNPAVVGDEHACQLGAWLNAKKPELEGKPEFNEIIRAHKDFHVVAGLLIVFHGLGDIFAVQHLVLSLKKASASVCAAVNELENCFRNSPRASGLDSRWPKITDSVSAWDDSLKLGIAAIDGQHEEIAKLADVLLQNPTHQLSSELGANFLGDLQKLLALHFDTEELLMVRTNHSAVEFEKHKTAHQAILEKMAELNFELAFSKIDMSFRELYALIEDMVVDHVVDFDLTLKPYLS